MEEEYDKPSDEETIQISTRISTKQPMDDKATTQQANKQQNTCKRAEVNKAIRTTNANTPHHANIGPTQQSAYMRSQTHACLTRSCDRVWNTLCGNARR